MGKKTLIKHFTVSGSIRERESGLGVGGLMVRAYDKDLVYDDLLGSAITDQEGKFSISYSERDFAELFESRPDIYLAVYAPPYRRLVETKDSVRWAASEQEEFEVVIDREKLGDLSPTRPSHVVEGDVSLGKDALIVERRDEFDVPRIEGFVNRGIPGAPALPEQIQQLALPRGSKITDLEIEPGAPVKRKGPLKLLPAQKPIPDVGTDPKQFGDGVSVESISIRFTPPDSKYYEGKQAPEQKLVELLGTVEIGPIQFVSVRVRPVQYNPVSKGLSFYPKLSYRARFETKEGPGGPAEDEDDKRMIAIQAHRAEFLQAYLEQESVYVAAGLLNFWQLLPEEYPHVIITDNYAWPESIDLGGGATRPPNLAERGGQLPGDVIGEFERLAKWKSQRGVRSRVVAISEIIGGQFGDFTEGGFARDLQEVIRNFIKHIYEEWGTTYVLFGGDVSVVPMRQLAGCNVWSEKIGCMLGLNAIHVPGQDVVKLRPDYEPDESDPLLTHHGGVLVPFDREAGPNRLGWYYTNENDFENLNSDFTILALGEVSHFIIVEGPANIITDDYYWIRDVNSIPSDLYYASLTGNGYSVSGRHDFDANDNGIYGQYHYDTQLDFLQPLDDTLLKFDIFVGRASVESGAEAQGFVDKIITYERLEAPNGDRVDTNYIAKILYASDYWFRRFQSRQINTAEPPDSGKFTHVAGTQITKIRIKSQYPVEFIEGSIVPDHRLIARHADRDKLISYRLAFENQPVWRFTTDDTFETESAAPTQYVVVEGPEVEVNPIQFYWDPIWIELATEQTEQLRAQMDDWFPNINSVQRFYWDYFAPLSSPPHLEQIKREPLLAALDAGVHFVSLTGHGSPEGCCLIDVMHNFSNANKYSVVFAESCSTARPDYAFDSLAETMTKAPNSAAVAYVGNTRFGWLGTGQMYEEAFWRGLELWGRVGPAVGSRWTLGMYDIWTFYAENLFGDPEMPVWTAIPGNQTVTHPSQVAWGDTFTVSVEHQGAPAVGARITVLGGWANSSLRPRVLKSKVTEHTGVATFRLPSSRRPISELSVTVTKKNFKPYIGNIQVSPA